MRKTRSLCACVMIICVMGLLSARMTLIEAAAYSLSGEEKDSFLKQINWESIDNDRYKSGIYCFDVAADGRIALGIQGDAIYVYDHSGKFQHGCSFQSEGTFGIEFDEKMLLLHFNRGDTILLIDEGGKCVDIQKADDPISHVILINEIRNQTAKKMEDKTYLLERDLDIGDSYSRFVIEENGKRLVLYDVTSDHLVKQVMLLASPICFFSFVFYGLVKKQNKKD